jgi:hypothetical protein
MSACTVKCRKGDPCSFEARVSTGIDARYTRARFHVREAWDEASPLLLSADETSGITIDHSDSRVLVVIGATKTAQLPPLRQPRQVAAQLRLYNADDADDRVSYAIPFELLPAVIVDAP